MVKYIEYKAFERKVYVLPKGMISNFDWAMSGMNIMDFTICVSPPYFDTTYITDIEEWKKVEDTKRLLLINTR